MKEIPAQDACRLMGYQYAITDGKDFVYNLYASKDQAERICRNLNENSGFDYTVVRIV